MLASPLTITGMGMVSGLGGAVEACAAARAGLVRAAPLDFAVRDSGSTDLVTVIGRTAGDLTQGFTEVGMATRLTSLALADLFRQTPVEDAELHHMAVLLNLPSGYYLQQADELTQRATRPASTPADTLSSFEKTKPLYDSVIDKSFSAIGKIPPPRSRQRIFFGDQAGIDLVLSEAHKLLADGGVTACLVGGVDSLALSQWTSACERLAILRTPLRPVGLIPGEAGAFSIVELARRKETRKSLGSIVRCEFGLESCHRFSGSQPDGRMLSDVIRRCLAGNADSSSLLTDINGDPPRSTELGQALVRLRPDIEFAETVVPATSFGDTRAASAFIGVSMALRAFHRGYASAPRFLVSAASDSGGRAALQISS